MTDKELDQGYKQCDCGSIHLLQAGFDVKLHCCALCKEWVADADEFFRTNEAADILSK